MKLSRIYKNRSDLFEPVYFQTGLNAVYAEIRILENKSKDTHNLGKSTLSRIIDFILLSKRDEDFFLFKREDIFSIFIFFIEIELNNSNYLTIRRSV